MPPTLDRPPVPLSLERESLRVVIFGEPGVGKSTFAAGWPRPVFCDTDAGMISLAVQGLTPMVFEPRGYKDMEGLYWWLKERRSEFDTIVIDSLTTAQRLFLDEIHDISLATKAGATKEVMRWNPEQGEYLAQQRQMARILTDLRRLDAHMVVTGGVKLRDARRSIDCAPGLFSIVSHWASIMGELEKTTVEKEGKRTEARVLRLSGNRDAKSRFASLRGDIVNPTFDAMWRRVQKEYAAAVAKSQPTTTEQGAA